MEVKGSDIRAENPNSLLLNLTLSYLLMKVLISNFSCILASAFLHWQRSISLLFAFRFCATRRVADEMVATRAIDIWPNFVTRIKDWEGQCQSNRLNNKSYETLVGHYQIILFHWEWSFSGTLQTCCRIFWQKSRLRSLSWLSCPVPLKSRKLCRIVLKGCILNEAATAYLLTQVDIEKKENQFNFDNVKLGTKQKQMLSWNFAVQPEKKRDSASTFEEA